MGLLNIDTTRLIFSDSQLQKIASDLKPGNTDILSPGEIALIAALIGALSAILAQLIIFILSSAKEKNQVKRELISEERSLSFLLTNFYSELAWLKVSYEFWYRSFSITSDASHYQQFLLIRDKIPECKREISSTMAKYFKTVTNFINLSKRKYPIANLLDSIKEFPPLNEQSSTFDDINDITTLNTQSDIESNRLKSEYFRLNTLLSEIHTEMNKSIS